MHICISLYVFLNYEFLNQTIKIVVLFLIAFYIKTVTMDYKK